MKLPVSLLVILRSALGLTIVGSSYLLLPEVESVTVLETEAVLVKLKAALDPTTTFKVIDELDPGAIPLALVQVTV